MKISICMATYNGEKFIKMQLDSILSQFNFIKNNPIEIIIADDNSTDDTLKIIKNFNDSRIKILPSQIHLGVIKNFERTLLNATGDVIFLSDQDDIWLPKKMGAVLEKLESCDLVLHDAFLFYNNERQKKLSEIRTFKKGLFFNWLKNNYTGCCLAFKKNILQKALPFPKNLPMHDQWLGLVAEKYYKVEYINEPLIEYRQHKNNATQILKSKATIFQKIKWRFDLLKIILTNFSF